MAWAKLHTDILGDPKLMRAARKGARHLYLLPWLFAFAKAAEDDGRLTVNGTAIEPEDLVPLIPGAGIRSIRACLLEAEEIGVLVRDPDAALRLTSWEKRSGKPSDAPESVRERVARHRALKREVTPPSSPPGNALQVTPGNAIEVEGEKRREEGEVEVETRSVTPLRRQLDRCRAEMPEVWRPALEGALRSARNPEALAAELCMSRDGDPLTGRPAYAWEVIGHALHDMAVAATPMSPKILAAFCRDLAAGRVTSASSSVDDVAAAAEAERARRDQARTARAGAGT
jgi:hypothetical protein